MQHPDEVIKARILKKRLIEVGITELRVRLCRGTMRMLGNVEILAPRHRGFTDTERAIIGKLIHKDSDSVARYGTSVNFRDISDIVGQ
jgi:hypothetical protein